MIRRILEAIKKYRGREIRRSCEEEFRNTFKKAYYPATHILGNIDGFCRDYSREELRRWLEEIENCVGRKNRPLDLRIAFYIKNGDVKEGNGYIYARNREVRDAIVDLLVAYSWDAEDLIQRELIRLIRRYSPRSEATNY